MDVIIVSTRDQQQENYWQKRLKQLKGIICQHNAIVIAVSEDWPNSPDNGLGTLYAYEKAQRKAKYLYQIDLYEKQKQGASVVIYHTAGYGKRLFPLTASENNSKSTVKLPSFFSGQQLSILETVIRQTLPLTKGREGRLSVFWGDQVVIPSKNFCYNPTYHIDILGIIEDLPLQTQGMSPQCEHHGLLAIAPSGQTQLLEKIDDRTLQQLILLGKLSKKSQRGISLGSFSFSSQMTFALLREFSQELQMKRGKRKNSLHFWMPLTLDLETYLRVMLKKNHYNVKELYDHHLRMQTFKAKFIRLHSQESFFGVVDIGNMGYWWDYSSTEKYYENIMKLTANDPEGQTMRLFYQIDRGKEAAYQNRVIKDDNSHLIRCNIRSGKISNSVLIGVNADSIEVKDSVIIDSHFSVLQADQSLLYHVRERNPLICNPGTIRADIILPITGEHLKMVTQKERNSKTDWERILPANSLSFQTLHHVVEAMNLS